MSFGRAMIRGLVRLTRRKLGALAVNVGRTVCSGLSTLVLLPKTATLYPETGDFVAVFGNKCGQALRTIHKRTRQTNLRIVPVLHYTQDVKMKTLKICSATEILWGSGSENG